MKVTYKQALCTNPTYVRTSWISIYIAFMAFCSGNYILGAETNIIFTRMDALVPGEPRISPRNATNIHYFCLLAGSISAIVTIQLFGRKTLALTGMAVNAIAFTVMAITVHFEKIGIASIMIFCGAYLTACTYTTV